MNYRLKECTYKIFIFSVLLLLLMSCGGSSTENAYDVKEDGARLISLMKKAQEAFENEDAVLFESTFTKDSVPQAKSIWKRFLKRSV